MRRDTRDHGFNNTRNSNILKLPNGTYETLGTERREQMEDWFDRVKSRGKPRMVPGGVHAAGPWKTMEQKTRALGISRPLPVTHFGLDRFASDCGIYREMIHMVILLTAHQLEGIPLVSQKLASEKLASQKLALRPNCPQPSSGNRSNIHHGSNASFESRRTVNTNKPGKVEQCMTDISAKSQSLK